MGGGPWGALPLASPLAAVFAPPDRGCPWAPPRQACGGVGENATRCKPTKDLGCWPKGPWPPAGGGGDTLARGSRGEYLPRRFPGDPPPDGPPRSRGSTTNRSEGPRSHPISTDFYRFFGLSWENTLPCCYSTCMLIFLVDSSSRGIASSDVQNFSSRVRFLYS